MSPRPHLRPSLLRAVPAVLLLALVAGCGGSDDDAEGTTSTSTTSSTTTTTEAAESSETVDFLIGSLMDDQVAADEDEARCVAERLVDELGDEGARELEAKSDDLSTLPDDQLELVRVTFNECVSGSVLAAAIANDLYATLDAETPAEVLSCIGDGYEGIVGDAMVEFSEARDEVLPESMQLALETCLPDEDFDAIFGTDG